MYRYKNRVENEEIDLEQRKMWGEQFLLVFTFQNSRNMFLEKKGSNSDRENCFSEGTLKDNRIWKVALKSKKIGETDNREGKCWFSVISKNNERPISLLIIHWKYEKVLKHELFWKWIIFPFIKRKIQTAKLQKKRGTMGGNVSKKRERRAFGLAGWWRKTECESTKYLWKRGGNERVEGVQNELKKEIRDLGGGLIEGSCFWTNY